MNINATGEKVGWCRGSGLDPAEIGTKPAVTQPGKQAIIKDPLVKYKCPYCDRLIRLHPNGKLATHAYYGG